MHIFLDEAERDILVIAAVVTDRPKELKNVLHRTRATKLPKRLRAAAEIKASQATEKFKRAFYARLANLQEPRLYAIHLNKKKIPTHLKGKEGLLYLRMVIALLESCPLKTAREIYVYPDKRPLKGVSQAGFIISLTQHFGVNLARQTRFEVYPRNSHDDLGVQAADFVAHAFFQKYQHGDATWYQHIKPLIKKELDALKAL